MSANSNLSRAAMLGSLIGAASIAMVAEGTVKLVEVEPVDEQKRKGATEDLTPEQHERLSALTKARLAELRDKRLERQWEAVTPRDIARLTAAHEKRERRRAKLRGKNGQNNPGADSPV